MKSLYVLAIVVGCLFCLTGCGALCGEPALTLRSPLQLSTLAPQNTLPKGNVGVFSGPVYAEAAPAFGNSACPVPGPEPAPLFGRAQLQK